MLAKLTIKNVALIERAEVEFTDGLNVLLGETGSGKSVILDSLNFVLGAKADKTMIRYGETECFVKAEFLVDENADAVNELREADIDSDGEIVISRRFSESGKSSIKVNGSTVTASMLRKITAKLVDLHGQSEHFFLLSEGNQLKTLDGVCGEPLQRKKDKLKELLSFYRADEKALAALGGNEEERERKIELLSFTIDEIKNAAWQEGEEEELLEKRGKINNLEKILSALKDAKSYFSTDGGACDAIRSALRSLNRVSSFGKEYEKLSDRLSDLSETAEDVASDLSDAIEEAYFDENEANYVENRLDEIRALKRKYGVNEQSEIVTLLQEKEEEYELLKGGAEKAELLKEQMTKRLKDVYAVCAAMTQERKRTAQDFCNRVCAQLKTLNILHASFSVAFKDYDESQAKFATENGLDDICFMFSANAGEPQKPLGKIISGGEMSRFMLAIKTQLSSLNGISTYVFDEIDAGISGKTAKIVGEKFADIAKQTQIIAVSHLAQIACMSDREFLIEKQETGGKTHTLIHVLDENGKKEEIVRLLGGEEGEKAALLHAEELLKKAQDYKNGNRDAS